MSIGPILLAFSLNFIQYCHSSPYSEKWGYINIRPGAYMFWWLYRLHDISDNRFVLIKRPLTIWLQGGPGDSSSGYGNFQEIGPLDGELERRNTSWLSRTDLLFVDSPVGSGFSYVESKIQLVESMDEMMNDLMNFTYTWLDTNKHFQENPVFIFGESYGGKMAVAYAQRIHQDINAGKLKLNLKGVGLGNSWISPADFVLSWPEFLYYHSWLSPRGLTEVRRKSEYCYNYTNTELWANATACIQELSKLVAKLTAGVSWYNILKHDKSDAYSKKLTSGDAGAQLDNLMNGPIRRKLGVIPDDVRWGAQADPVYFALYDEITRPAINIVDYLLQNTNLHIIIYNGQLDLICNTPAVQNWLTKLTWSEMEKFYESPRQYLAPVESSSKGPSGQDLFMQRQDRLWFFWVLHAGHNVPADAGEAALRILDTIFAEVLIKGNLRRTQ